MRKLKKLLREEIAKFEVGDENLTESGKRQLLIYKTMSEYVDSFIEREHSAFRDIDNEVQLLVDLAEDDFSDSANQAYGRYQILRNLILN